MPSPSQATGADGLEGEDVALPECAPAEASVLNVLEAKEDGKEEEKDEKEEARSFAAGAFAASDAEQPKAEPVDGSGSDGEDALETLGHAPLESESDVGTPGQHCDSDVQIDDSPAVQQPTLLEDVAEKTSSREKMETQIQEKREPEGLLAPGLQATWRANACDMSFGPFRPSHEHTHTHMYVHTHMYI